MRDEHRSLRWNECALRLGALFLILSRAPSRSEWAKSKDAARYLQRVCALLFLLAAATARADPLAIRVAWTQGPAQLLPLLLEKKDLFAHERTSYTVETVAFAQSATALRAMAAGKIDFEALSPIEFAVAVENAGLDDLRIVAEEFRDGAEGYYSAEFMVRDESPIRTVDDLAGRVAAVDAAESMAGAGLTLMLRRYGLEEGKDYRRVELPLGLMGAILEGRKIDLAALPAPFSYALRERARPRTLFTLKDAIGPSEGLMLVARAQFLDQNRAALEDFFADYLIALHWFLDPDHRAEAVLIAADVTHLPQDLLETYLFTDADYFHDPGARPDLGNLQRTINLLQQAGILGAPLDVRSHADLGLIEAAAQRLD
jgi:sulfonate transport system substrate-binding protein